MVLWAAMVAMMSGCAEIKVKTSPILEYVSASSTAAVRTASRSYSSNLYISAAQIFPSKRAKARCGKCRSAASMRPLADTLPLCSTLLAAAALVAAFKNVALGYRRATAKQTRK